MSETLSAPLTPAEQDERYLPYLPVVEEALFEHYDPRLPYHWRRHGEETRDKSLYFREMLMARGFNMPSEFVTVVSADGHDAGTFAFHRFGLKKKYGSAENYGSHLTTGILELCGTDKYTVEEIRDIQRPTKAGIKCVTLGEFNLCLSDVYNTCEDYDSVLVPKKELLRQEYSLLKDEDLGEDGYTDFTLGILPDYNVVNLDFDGIRELGEEFTKARQKQAENLLRMFTERTRSLGSNSERLIKYARKLGPSMMKLANLG